jgi:hypothetical protein
MVPAGFYSIPELHQKPQILGVQFGGILESEGYSSLTRHSRDLPAAALVKGKRESTKPRDSITLGLFWALESNDFLPES